mmetsp:Transcript_87273/g.281965  ORF Transcript_87273/g.281965 Transcript_87273/m.281965 type:complete len:575 (-) Transcript_87273:162-1886(-)
MGAAQLCCEKKSADRRLQRDSLVYCSGNIREFYEFGSAIGQGAFGSVHKGYKRAQKVVDSVAPSPGRVTGRAIKVLGNQDEGLEVLHHEIDLLAELDHPNICRLYEAFQDDSHTYLVMELCEGGDLFQAIVNSSTFSETEAAHVVQQIFQAVRYLHQKNISHRDIKGENFLLQKEEAMERSIIKLVDFGTARHFDPKDGMMTALGTPIYMAPEVLKKTYGAACDLWSCGCMLFIMLCGHAPFHGNSDNETIKLARSAPLNFRPAFWSHISQEAVDLVRQLLQRDVELRYTAAQALDHVWLHNTDTQSAGQDLDSSRLKQRQLGETDIGELREVFISIDTDKTGFVSREELNAVLQKGSVENADDILESMDADGDGLVDYREFLVATMDKNYYRQESVLQEAFSVFDSERRGHITAKDITRVLTSGGMRRNTSEGEVEGEVEGIMEELGKTVADDISFEEFAAMMSKTRLNQNERPQNERPANEGGQVSRGSTLDWKPIMQGKQVQGMSPAASMNGQVPSVAAPVLLTKGTKNFEWAEGPGNEWRRYKSTRSSIFTRSISADAGTTNGDGAVERA